MTTPRLPDEFVVVASVVPGLRYDLKYTYHDNIVGRPLRGYAPDGQAILTKRAAESLKAIVRSLRSLSLETKEALGVIEPNFLIYEAYRPLQAGDDFWEWAKGPDQKTKEQYYPRIDKNRLFDLGYIVRPSSHSRGSTLDLTIIDEANGQVLDMGTPFDYMDELSYPRNQQVDPRVYERREFLQILMQEHGWKGIKQEWWHFTYLNEPFPDTYFDFPVVNYEF